METVCHKQLSFERLVGKRFEVDFSGGRITSDGGGLLLREVDLRYGLTEGIASCLRDPRDPQKVTHEMRILVAQRIFSIALGYEDANDATKLRRDPALKAMAGRLPDDGEDLASQPTLSRLENQVSAGDIERLNRWLMEFYVAVHPKRQKLIVVDVDSTDEPTHGHQQLSFFHGYFDQHMYHPLLVFDGLSGFPIAVMLRPGNVHSADGVVELLKPIIQMLKRAYRKADIVLRADAGFAVPELYELCEKERIYYVIGMITNERLRATVKGLAAQAEEAFLGTGQKQRKFTSFGYRAEGWKRTRRVIAKVEHLDKGPNQRFVVTNIEVLKPEFLYDDFYVLRGDVENRIKELKVELSADRLSCHRFVANWFRLLLHTAAYCLFWLLRQHLEGTQLAVAQVGTLRLKLLKIGAQVRETTRRIWVRFASGYPYQELFAEIVHRLRQAPT